MPTQSKKLTAAAFLRKYPNLADLRIEDINVHGYRLPGIHLQGTRLSEVIFSDNIARRSLFTDATASACTFDYTDFSFTDFNGFNCSNCSFDSANLEFTTWNAGYSGNLATCSFRNVRGAVAFSKVGSREDTLLVVRFGNMLMYKTGCFWGTKEDFEERIRETHGRFNGYAAEYRKCIKEAEKKLLK